MDSEADFFDADSAAGWCFKETKRCGCGEKQFDSLPALYIPLKSKHSTIGVALLDCPDGAPQPSEVQLAETVLSEVTIAVERDRLRVREEENLLKIHYGNNAKPGKEPIDLSVFANMGGNT